MRRRLWFVIHDCLAHPICGLLWALGFERLGVWLHDATVHTLIAEDEVWPVKEE